MKMSEVFKLPLYVKDMGELLDFNGGCLCDIEQDSGRCHVGMGDEELETIVHAVNSHDELTKQLDEAVRLGKKLLDVLEDNVMPDYMTIAWCDAVKGVECELRDFLAELDKEKKKVTFEDVRGIYSDKEKEE